MRRWLVMIGLVFSTAVGYGQGPELHRVMRQKLVHAQKILEAVVTDDWAALETHTRQLEQLTNDPGWAVLKYPEYARHSAAFVRTMQALHTAAARRDLDGTPRAYAAVTLRCVECHRYVARVRIAD